MSEGLQQTASTVHAAKATQEAEQAVQEMMQAAGGALLLKLQAVAQGSHSNGRRWRCAAVASVEPTMHVQVNHPSHASAAISDAFGLPVCRRA